MHYFLIIVLVFTGTALAADRPILSEALAHSVVMVVANKGQTVETGSGFLVDANGTVATSFQLVQGAGQVAVVFADTKRISATGFTAARKGKDLILLSIGKPPQGAKPLELSHDPPKPNQNLILLVAVPIVSNPFIAQFVDLKSEEEIETRSIMSPLQSDKRPYDPDLIWLEAVYTGSTGYNGSLLPLRGSAVVDDKNKAVGVWNENRAVYINHVEDLLRQAKRPGRPFSELAKLSDQPVEKQLDTAPQLELKGNLGTRGLTLVERLDRFSQRQADFGASPDSLHKKDRQLEQKISDLGQVYQELQAKAVKNRQGKSSINPEEKYTETVRSSNRDTKSSKDDKGPNIDRDEEVVKYRFSEQQKREIAKLDSEYFRLDIQARGANSQAASAQALRDEISGVLKNWNDRPTEGCNELLGILDLSNFADSTEHQAAVEWLTSRLKTAGVDDQGQYLLARALSYQSLGKFKEARADFEEAADVDVANRPMHQAALARLLILQGAQDEGDRILHKIPANSKNGSALVFRALAECASGSFYAAQLKLDKAMELGADKAEVHRLEALMYVTATNKADRNAIKAVQHAQFACELTFWKHWPSLLALSAAQAAAGQKEQAAKTANRAIEFANGENHQRCQQWADDLKASKPFEVKWN